MTKKQYVMNYYFLLKEYEMKFKMIFDISIYYNGENLLADLEDDIHFDLILLDIELAKD